MFACQPGDVLVVWLEIRRSQQFRTAEQSCGRAADPVQALTEIEGFAIVPNGTNRMQLASPQRGEVVHDGSGGTRIAADGEYLMSDSSCFEAGLRQFRSDFQVLIEKEIAEHSDAMSGKQSEKLVQAIQLHLKHPTIKQMVRVGG